MTSGTRPGWTLILWLGLVFSVSGGWLKIDDFETYSVGQNLNGLGNWTASTVAGAATIIADPAAPGKKCAQVTRIPYSDKGAHNALGANSIGETATGTVFFRLRAPSPGNPSFSVGLTTNAFPVAQDGNEAFLVIRHRGNSCYDGATHRVYSNGSLGTNVWVKYWLVVYNATDKWEIYQEGNNVPTQTKLVSGSYSLFNFYKTTALALTHFGVAVNQWGNPDTIYFDDIYIDKSGVNLKDPTLPQGSIVIIK